MRIAIVAVGKARGATRGMVEGYLKQLPWPARVVEVREEAERPDRRRREGEAILRQVPEGARLVALDRTGKAPDSEGFARQIGQWRDGGVRELVFAIGGADGLDEAVLARADARLSLGPQTWPHMLARVMLAEQLFRGAAILAGHPYHR